MLLEYLVQFGKVQKYLLVVKAHQICHDGKSKIQISHDFKGDSAALAVQHSQIRNMQMTCLSRGERHIAQMFSVGNACTNRLRKLSLCIMLVKLAAWHCQIGNTPMTSYNVTN